MLGVPCCLHQGTRLLGAELDDGSIHQVDLGDAGSSSEPRQGKGKTGGRGLHSYLIEKVHTIGSQPLVGVFAWWYTHCCCNVSTVQQGKCLETMAEVNQSSRVAHLPRVF